MLMAISSYTQVFAVAEPDALPSIASQAVLGARLDVLADGLRQPTGLVSARDSSGRLFALERAGRIMIVRDGSVQTAPFLDIRLLVGSGYVEQGLLGLAFDPAYTANGRLYVDYTNRAGNIVVARYFASADPDRAEPGSA